MVLLSTEHICTDRAAMERPGFTWKRTEIYPYLLVPWFRRSVHHQHWSPNSIQCQHGFCRANQTTSVRAAACFQSKVSQMSVQNINEHVLMWDMRYWVGITASNDPSRSLTACDHRGWGQNEWESSFWRSDDSSNSQWTGVCTESISHGVACIMFIDWFDQNAN